MSHKIDLTTLSGGTTTVTINAPGKWLIFASVLIQPIGDSSSINYSIIFEWIGRRRLVNGFHSGNNNFFSDNNTLFNVVDVQDTYTSQLTYTSGASKVQQTTNATWLAIKIGPAS